jgi:hypothetical protein
MHEEDHLDRMLYSALSNYGDSEDHGADPGLPDRILARVSNETKAIESAPGWRNRFVLWAALPLAACLLLTVFVLKSAGPPAIRPSTHPPDTASVTPKSQAPVIANVPPAQNIQARATRRTMSRPVVAAAGSAVRPKRDVFPLPHPLSPEEQALYAFATQVPEEQRQAVLAAQKKDDAPLDVAAISIQPIEIPDTGKN